MATARKPVCCGSKRLNRYCLNGTLPLLADRAHHEFFGSIVARAQEGKKTAND